MLTKDEVGEMMEMLSGKQFASNELDQVRRFVVCLFLVFVCLFL
jgi:hypothetical protein